MTNADKFKNIFGLYATELWSMPEKDFLKWLNSEAMNCSEIPTSWIPVSERPPEKTCATLVTTVWGQNDRVTEYSYYFDDIEWGNITENVIAWMPLPKPYGGDKE